MLSLISHLISVRIQRLVKIAQDILRGAEKRSLPILVDWASPTEVTGDLQWALNYFNKAGDQGAFFEKAFAAML
jgi:hypothetical protein